MNNEDFFWESVDFLVRDLMPNLDVYLVDSGWMLTKRMILILEWGQNPGTGCSFPPQIW